MADRVRHRPIMHCIKYVMYTYTYSKLAAKKVLKMFLFMPSGKIFFALSLQKLCMKSFFG